MLNQSTYFDKYSIVFPLSNQRILFLFDIDGVVCEAKYYELEKSLSKDAYNDMIMKRTCFPIFLNTVTQIQRNQIMNRYSIQFLTGRKEESKSITKQMFINSKLGHLSNSIMFYPNTLSWEKDQYINHKTKVIRNLLPKYDILYYFDDNDLLMTHLKSVFKLESRMILIHVF